MNIIYRKGQRHSNTGTEPREEKGRRLSQIPHWKSAGSSPYLPVFTNEIILILRSISRHAGITKGRGNETNQLQWTGLFSDGVFLALFPIFHSAAFCTCPLTYLYPRDCETASRLTSSLPPGTMMASGTTRWPNPGQWKWGLLGSHGERCLLYPVGLENEVNGGLGVQKPSAIMCANRLKPKVESRAKAWA